MDTPITITTTSTSTTNRTAPFIITMTGRPITSTDAAAEKLPRKRTTTMGPTRSVRLPQAIDQWFEERLARHLERSPSEVLVALVHGGLRLREGYMAIHRRVLEGHVRADRAEAYATYVACLADTFGTAYVEHLERWLVAENVIPRANPA